MIKFKSEDFHQLPKDLSSMIDDDWHQATSYFCQSIGITPDSLHAAKSMKKDESSVKILDGRTWVNLNNYTYNLDGNRTDLNQDREVHLMKMFESIYFNLDMYLNDFQKSKLLNALDDSSSIDSWNVFFFKFKVSLSSCITNDRIKTFIVTGLKILKTNSIYKMEKRWQL